MAKDDRPLVIFVLGGPGSGKGTQCGLIAKHYGFHHISAGDCLREERQRTGSPVGKLIEDYIREGKIVPIEITCQLLRQKMQELGWVEGRFLVDGFPRNLENLQGWLKACNEDVRTEFVLNLVCPDDLMVKRMVERGAAGSGRIDDNLESAKKRLETFHRETEPVLQHFKDQGRCLSVPSNRPTEETWSDLGPLMNRWLETGILPVNWQEERLVENNAGQS